MMIELRKSRTLSPFRDKLLFDMEVEGKWFSKIRIKRA
jgi:hypothetical protein